MTGIYKRRLTPTEAQRHYIYIAKDVISELFPSQGKSFKIRVGKKQFQVKIDSQGRIMASLFREYIDFEEGNVFIFKKNTDGSFTLSLEK